jgi:hypothetical protein
METDTVRRRRAPDLKSEGKDLAERMGYHWAENTDPSLPLDGLMFRRTVMIAVTMMKVRYGPGDDCRIEDKYSESVAEVRSLPLPPNVFRELWLRTQNERAYRRFLILPGATAEIEENTRDGYRNTHYREAYWKKAPYRGVVSLPDIPNPLIDPDDTPREGGSRKRVPRKTP